MTIPAGLHLTPIDGEHAEPDPIDAFKKLRAQAHAAATSSTDADPIAEFKALRAQALSASLSKAATSESTRALPDDRERRAKDAATPNLLSTGLLREAEQGATFAFGDELNAAVRAIGKEKYSEALAKERAALHEYEDAHPVATLGAQITGGLAGGAGLGAAAKAIGIGAKAASAVPLTSRFGKLWQATKTAGTAAAAGGVAAAGTAEGDLEDRAKAIPMGAAFGVGTAAGLKLGGRVAGKLIPRPASSTSALGQAADRVGLSSHDELAKGDLLSQIKRARMSLPDVEDRKSVV